MEFINYKMYGLLEELIACAHSQESYGFVNISFEYVSLREFTELMFGPEMYIKEPDSGIQEGKYVYRYLDNDEDYEANMLTDNPYRYDLVIYSKKTDKVEVVLTLIAK